MTFLTLTQGRRALCAALLAAGLATSAGAADTYDQTRYPVVLVHGLLGFDKIGPIDYFYGVPSALRASGAVVYTPSVSATGSNEVRGEQLLAQLRQLKAAYGYSKFNLIGHSQGGPTARYVASVAPDLVASVTSVGSPHQGSAAADGIQSLAAKFGITGLVASAVNTLATAVSWLSGKPLLPQDALAALTALNTTGAKAFNQRFPAGAPTTSCGQGAATVNGIRYYSVGGTWVATNVLDLSDPFLVVTAGFFGFEANDGLVGRCSSHWGTVLRDDYPWNHLDEVNQAFGLRGVFTPDPVQFYRGQVNRLKLAGL